MPIGGETVGTAFVRILADGSGLNQSIRDSFDENADAIDAAGDRDSDRYQKRWEKEMKKGPKGGRLSNSIEDAIARSDAADAYFGSKKWQKFRRELKRKFGEAGSLAGRNLEQGILEGGGDLSVLKSRLNNVTREVSTAVRQIQNEEIQQNHRMMDEALRMNKDFDRAIKRQREGQDRDWEVHIARQQRGIQLLHSNMALITDDVERFARGERTIGTRKDLLTHLRDLDTIAKSAGKDTHEWSTNMERLTKRLLFANPILEKTNLRIHQFADGVGKGFGRGARNDFINFFGAVVRGFALLPSAPIVILDKMSDAVRHVGLTFSDARRRGLDPFSAALSTVGTIGNKAINGLIGLGAGFAGVTLLVGSAVAVLSQLIGVITALVSTVAIGAVGALGALGGAIAPVIAGIGAVAIAFIGMSKAEKAAVKQDFKPLVKELRGLGAAVRSTLLDRLPQQAKALAPVINGLHPLFRRLGTAIADVGDNWITALRGPGFVQFREAMEKFLPDAIRSLGLSFRRFVGGMGGLLRGMIPITQDFLGWLEKITLQFDRWANSTRGQNELQNFFEKAGHSAATLGDFLLSVTKLLATILSQGRSTGDSLFGSMTKSINDITDKIRSNPDLLRGWFKSAEEFGHVLGRLIVGVGDLFDALDNPTTRAAANTIVSGLAAAFTAVSQAINSLGPIVSSFVGKVIGATIIFVKLRSAVSGSIAALVGYTRAAAGAGAASATLGAGTNGAVSRLSLLRNAGRTAAGVGGILALVGASQSSSKAMEHLSSTAGLAALGFSVGGPWGAAIGGAVGVLKSLFDQTRLTASVQAELSSAADEVAGALDQETGAVTRNTIAVARKKLADTGMFDVAQRMGVNLNDLTQAYLGNRDAIRRVGLEMQRGYARRMREGGDAVNGLSDDVNKLNGVIDTGRSKFTAARRHINQVRLAADEAAASQHKFGGSLHDAQDHANGMGAALDRLAKKKPKPSVLLIDKASKLMNSIDRNLDGLGKKRPKPIATLVDKATALANVVSRNLDELGKKHPNPKVVAEVGEALARLAAVRNAIANIRDKTITIRSRHIVEQAQGNAKRAETAPGGASGGLFEGPRGIGVLRRIGEEGREALVPLNRPLSQVDPAVRALSAIAQGKIPGMASGGIVGGGGKTVDASGWTIVVPNTNTEAVAASVVNKLVAQMY